MNQAESLPISHNKTQRDFPVTEEVKQRLAFAQRPQNISSELPGTHHL
jgi:hypothetical protein